MELGRQLEYDWNVRQNDELNAALGEYEKGCYL